MAKDESFLLVSLQDDKTKKLAQVISSETSRKILDFLSQHKSATETQISKALKLPISTVHYNIQHLLKAKLIEAEEFHYSEKGKEVQHYSLANKYVVIAPKDAPVSLKDKLKKILPIFVALIGVALLLQVFNVFDWGSPLSPVDSALESQSANQNAPDVTESASKSQKESTSDTSEESDDEGVKDVFDSVVEEPPSMPSESQGSPPPSPIIEADDSMQGVDEAEKSKDDEFIPADEDVESGGGAEEKAAAAGVVTGTVCGGSDSEGDVLCKCDGTLTQEKCDHSPNCVVYLCDGACSACQCFKGDYEGGIQVSCVDNPFAE